MNNEPVAWMVERTTGTKGYGDTPYVTLLDATKSAYWIENKIPEGYTVIPLYTHPVKEMSETRIKQIFVEQTGFYFDDNPADDLALMDFAKALLLEAQEK
jgi:hypothetical protein